MSEKRKDNDSIVFAASAASRLKFDQEISVGEVLPFRPFITKSKVVGTNFFR